MDELHLMKFLLLFGLMLSMLGSTLSANQAARGPSVVTTPEPGGFGMVAGAGLLLVSLGTYRRRSGRKPAADTTAQTEQL